MDNVCHKCLQAEVDRLNADKHLNDWPGYAQAKTRFEAAVNSLQADLHRYAAQPGASARAIQVKTDIINQLIEFYQVTCQHLSDINWYWLQTDVMHLRLMADTEKLLLLCRLYGVNPNLVFYYSKDELMMLYNSGARFTLPKRSFEHLAFDGKYTEPEAETLPEADDKLMRLLQFVR